MKPLSFSTWVLLAGLALACDPGGARAQVLEPAGGQAPGPAGGQAPGPAGSQVPESAATQEPEPVRVPVALDGVTVYWSVAPDTATAAEEARHVLASLLACRARLRDPEALMLEEQDASAILRLDTLTVLTLRPENRVDLARSALANAIAVRRQVIRPLLAAEGRGEEELALRLFLGIVFPLLLLVALRSTRYGLRRWEQRWRSPLRASLQALAERRRIELPPGRIQSFIRVLTGLERLIAFGFVSMLVAFLWFAIFPESRPLALTLLNRVLGPVLELLEATARGVLTFLYTLFILALAVLANRWLGSRWRRGFADPLGDPALHVPLRVGVWLLAVFLMLLPYGGAPRLFALGLLVLVILITLITLRPVGEEVGCGIYLNAVHALRVGDRITLEDGGEDLDIVHVGLARLRVRSHEGERWLPYSRLLKTKLSVRRSAGHQP